MTDLSKSKITGHVLIKDTAGNVLLDQYNAIHPENFAFALAESVGRKPNGPIYKMVFGNGGTSVNGLGVITYQTPNTVGASATLYNETYDKIVDDTNSLNLDPSRNNIVIDHTTGQLYSDVIVTCTLDYGEPSGQNAFDNSSSANGTYVFDELGLENYGGLLLSHIIFSPLEKALDRLIVVQYTIRILIG